MDSFGLCVPTHGCGINVSTSVMRGTPTQCRLDGYWVKRDTYSLLSNSTFVSNPLVDTEPCICDGEPDVSRQVSPLHRLIKNKQLRLFLGMRVCWEGSVRDHSGFVKLTNYFSASRLEAQDSQIQKLDQQTRYFLRVAVRYPTMRGRRQHIFVSDQASLVYTRKQRSPLT